MAEQPVSVIVDIKVNGEKSLRALRRVTDVMKDVAEDFPYRDDVRGAIKALNYLMKNLVVATTADYANGDGSSGN